MGSPCKICFMGIPRKHIMYFCHGDPHETTFLWGSPWRIHAFVHGDPRETCLLFFMGIPMKSTCLFHGDPREKSVPFHGDPYEKYMFCLLRPQKSLRTAQTVLWEPHARELPHSQQAQPGSPPWPCPFKQAPASVQNKRKKKTYIYIYIYI